MRRITAMLVIALSLTAIRADDWRQFRGNEANGVSSERGDVPLRGKEWTAALPGRGISGPIVVRNRVYVTASDGYRDDRLHVLCFDADTGEQQWERQFWATGSTLTHPKICSAAPTPASDGERLFAFFSSNDLICLDLEGRLLWYRGLTLEHPNVSNSLGMASSPLVVGDTLIVQAENDSSESIAVGIDTATGESRWLLARPNKANWTSPTILKGKTPNDDLALLQSAKGLMAIQPKTGDTVWSYEQGASTISSPAVVDGTIYVPSGGITALRPPRNSVNVEQLWRSNRLSPSFISPVVSEGRVYILNGAGVLVCADATTGATAWQLRLRGPFTSSPVVADGKMYCFNEEGVEQVVNLRGERGELMAEKELGETILCTPAIADGALYVRSDRHLWKLAR